MAAVRVLLATRNAHKLEEFRRIIAAQAPDDETGVLTRLEIVGTDDVEPYEEVAETGATFTANALLKARAGAAASGLVAIGDDSGLSVDSLGGMPGILSARWAGRHGDDAANLQLLLNQLADLPAAHRTAAFYCAAAVVTPDGRSDSTVGVVRGSLLSEPRGVNGFGYDPLFVPHGHPLSTAEMTSAEKDALSHRGAALRALAPLLAALLA
jgi:XTP/dITP diphosphohydrolase